MASRSSSHYVGRLSISLFSQTLIPRFKIAKNEKIFSNGNAVPCIHFGLFTQKVKQDCLLFWKVTGNDLKKPSYLFGTYHLLTNGFVVGGNLRWFIKQYTRYHFSPV
jgi:hypothetical protein